MKLKTFAGTTSKTGWQQRIPSVTVEETSKLRAKAKIEAMYDAAAEKQRLSWRPRLHVWEVT